jgi:hypothetical protein
MKKCIYTVYKDIHIHTFHKIQNAFIQCMYTLLVPMSTSGIVIHNMGSVCQAHNTEGIHCFKWKFCVRFARRFSGT